MQRFVKVDGKVRTDATYPAGFMDVIEIEKTNENFRLVYDAKGRFVPHRVSKEEAAYKLCKVKRQQLGKSGVPYITTHDGRTIRYPDPDIKVAPAAVQHSIVIGSSTQAYRYGALSALYSPAHKHVATVYVRPVNSRQHCVTFRSTIPSCWTLRLASQRTLSSSSLVTSAWLQVAPTTGEYCLAVNSADIAHCPVYSLIIVQQPTGPCACSAHLSARPGN